MLEKKSQDASTLFDVTDIANEADMYEIESGSEFRSDDIKLTPQIKILFLLFTMSGFLLSVLYLGLYPIFIWGLVIVFVMDLMGMLDNIEDFFKSGKKSRGGYDNIE